MGPASKTLKSKSKKSSKTSKIMPAITQTISLPRTVLRKDVPSPLDFVPIPRSVIERYQHDDQKNEYINKAMKHIKSIRPAINEDYFLSGPTYQKLYRINKFLYDNNLANARTNLTKGIYGGVKESDNKGTIQDLINASEHIGSYHYDSNWGPLPGPVPSFYRGGPTIDRMRPRPPSPPPPSSISTSTSSSPNYHTAPSSPITEGRKKLREEPEDPNPSLISPVPFSDTGETISNPTNVRHRLFQYPNSNQTPAVTFEESDRPFETPSSPSPIPEGSQNKDKITSKYTRPEPYTLSERNEAIERWRMKRERRDASSDNRYKVRQDFANSRKRFKGRFIPKGGKTKKRKWSLKYKRSINCKKPKGFSQKQYCKRVNKTRRKTKRTTK